MAKLPFEFTKPAIIAAFSYLVLAFMILLPLNNYKMMEEDVVPVKQNFGYRVMILLLMVIPIGLSIYSINCMMVGKCVMWSYLQAIFIAVWVVLFVIATLISSERQTVVLL